MEQQEIIKNDITFKVSIRIILLFSTAILLSFIPEYLHSFFGDWLCSGSGERLRDVFHYERCNYWREYHNPEWHWGYRHWLFLAMGICLAIVQVINIVILIDKSQSK